MSIGNSGANPIPIPGILFPSFKGIIGISIVMVWIRAVVVGQKHIDPSISLIPPRLTGYVPVAFRRCQSAFQPTAR